MPRNAKVTLQDDRAYKQAMRGGGLDEDKPCEVVDWARTSHRPYYATMDQLAKPVHRRGDGLSSPSFADRFIAFSSLKFAPMDRYPGQLVNLS